MAVVCLSLTSMAGAKDLRSRWYFDGSLGLHTTQDTIRSNADLRVDPRPTDDQRREISLDDTVSFGLTTGFGLNSWLALQLDAGYFKGEVNRVFAFLSDSYRYASNPADPQHVNAVGERNAEVNVNAGTVTEIPVILSAIVRFRRDKQFSPYVGVGAGELFVKIEPDQDVARLNDRLRHLHIINEYDERENNLTPRQYWSLRSEGAVPLLHPLDVQADGGFATQLRTGLEYSVNDRISIVADLSYMFTSAVVRLDLAGEDQVNIDHYSEKLYRADGTLKYFNDYGYWPNPWVDPNDHTKGFVTCTLDTTGDFDHDGHANDLCYPFFIGGRQAPASTGTFVVQGGTIDLSGFTGQVGLRFLF